MAVRNKRVRWSTVTIHEFGVGHGGSAVPQTGPSIGLSRDPEFTWSTRVGAMARECDGVRRFTSQERIALLQSAGFSSDRVDAFVAEAKRVRRSRALYYSSEMKQLRKLRKRAKAEAAATGATTSIHPPVAVPMPVAVPVAVVACHVQEQGEADDNALYEERTDGAVLRIDVPGATAAALVPPALPVSPCCS